MKEEIIKAIQVKFLEDMKELNYPKWVAEKNRQYSLNLSMSGISHVAKGLANLTMMYAGNLLPSHFLREVMLESLVSACCQADAINMMAIPIYADFLFHIVPAELRIKK